MIVGVPFWAVIYAMVRRVTNRQLKKRDLPTDTGEYLNVEYIKEKEFIQRDSQQSKSFFKLKRKKTNQAEAIDTDGSVTDNNNNN